MKTKLTKEQFIEELINNIREQQDTLFTQYERASGDSIFPISSQPLETPEFVPEKPIYSLDELNKRVDDLELASGIEKIAIKVGGILIKLGIIALK